MFGFFKRKVEEIANKKKVKIALAVDTLSDIQQFYDYCSTGEDATFEEIVSMYEDAWVKSKADLLLAKSKTYYKALNYDGCKKPITTYTDEHLIKNLDWNSFDRFVFYSRIFGFSVIQLLWDKETRELRGFLHLDPRMFIINTDPLKGDIGDLFYNTINLTKEYPFNFICIKNDTNFMYQCGQSVLRQLRDVIAFKRLLTKIKQRYYQRSVIPAFAALYKSDKNGEELTEQVDVLSTALSNIQNGSGVALPNVDTISVLSPNGQVNFERTEDQLNKIIAVRLLGSDLTDSQKSGSYAQANVAKEYVEGNVKELGGVMQQYRNTVIKKAIQVKFGISENSPEYIYDFNEPYPPEHFKLMQELLGYCSASEAAKVLPMPKGFVIPKDDILILKDYNKIMTNKQENENADQENNKNEE